MSLEAPAQGRLGPDQGLAVAVLRKGICIDSDKAIPVNSAVSKLKEA